MSEMETPAPPAPDPEPEPIEPEWSGPSRDEWEQAQTLLSEYEQLRQQQYQAQQPPQQDQVPPIPDPWAENYQEQVAAREAWLMAPYQQFQQQIEMQQGRDAALSYLEKDAAANGPLTDPGRIWDQAQYLVGTGQVQRPQNDHEANKLLTDLARQQREYDKKVGEAYHQQQLEQMQTIQGGQRRLPSPAIPGAAQTVSAGGYGNVPGAVERRFFGGN